MDFAKQNTLLEFNRNDARTVYLQYAVSFKFVVNELFKKK